jgi:hypothetical protein
MTNFFWFWLALVSGLLLACDSAKEDAVTDSGPADPPPASTRVQRAPRESTNSQKSKFQNAINKAFEIEDVEERELALADIAVQACESAPSISSEALSHLPAGGEVRASVIARIVAVLLERNAEEALDWAQTLPFKDDTALAREEIAAALSESDPERAAKLVMETSKDHQEPSEAAVMVLQTWASTAPQAAADWVAKLPPGPARESGIKAIASVWMSSDAKAVLAWVGGIRHEETKKEYTRGLIGALSEIPEPIREVYLQEVDPALREALLIQIQETQKEREAKAEPEEEKVD